MGLFVIDITQRLAEHAGRSTIKYIFMLLNHGGISIGRVLEIGTMRVSVI